MDLQALVNTHLTAENEHRLEATLATLHEECVFEDRALGQIFHGREGAAEYYTTWWNAFNLVVKGEKRHWTSEPVMIAETHYQGTHVGDFLGIPNIRKGQSNILSYSFIGAGIVAAGGAFIFHHKSNQTFAEYEAAKTTGDAVRLYDKTASFDTKSRISFGVAGGFIVVGVVTYLLNHSKEPSFSKYSYSIEPVQRQEYVGLKFKLDLDKIGIK